MTAKTPRPYTIRAVQLDLARQMETIGFIKSFIDFSSTNGFNTLLLYLEARVKTPAFPWARTNESYTPEEMRQIVDYAAAAGMDVIPCVSCLGHAEQFLQYPAMKPLAEVQQEEEGRFGDHEAKTFCPSKPETRSFLDSYLREICGIFPSAYVHVGFDEVFDFACCPECATNDFDGEQDLFLAHLRFCHDLLCGELGRQMMIFDDMFELYPDILERIPRDIILVCWLYQPDVQQPRGHFLNQMERDPLSCYDRLGIRYLIAPGDLRTSNVTTFTRYADAHQPLGGLLTMWEKQSTFLYRTYPNIAYAGRLWSRPDEVNDECLFADAVRDLFGCDDALLARTFRTIAESGCFMDGTHSLQHTWFVDQRGLDHAFAAQVRLLLSCLEHTAPLVAGELGRRVHRDVSMVFAFQRVRSELDKAATEHWGGHRLPSNPAEDLAPLIHGLEDLRDARCEQWNQWRPGLEPNHVAVHYDRLIATLRQWSANEEPTGVLRVVFCLPDKFSGEQCRISLLYEGAWVEIAQGIFKGHVYGDSMYTYYYPIDAVRIPTGVRIESWGAGGQGIAYVEAHNPAGRFRPRKILAVSGIVHDPEFLLENDAKPAFLGEKNTILTFRNRSLYHRVHCLECSLAKETDHDAPRSVSDTVARDPTVRL